MGIGVLPLLCLALVAAALKWLLDSGVAERIAIDQPNERSLHAVPIPRIGGIVLLLVALAVSACAAPGLVPLLLVAAALALISAWDDRHGLSVSLRLTAHLAAAVVALLLLPTKPSLWVTVLAVLLLTWAMNLYNFMDGSDGLAGGMTVFGFGALGAAAANTTPEMAAVCFCVAGAAAGFLLHNFHPARVFLGDAGSVPLGFLAGGLGLAGWTSGDWPIWFPVLAFSPFVVDASLTLAVRLLHGEKPWQAHRQHAYQRMVAGGLGHRRTALLWYALMLACSTSALLGLRLDATRQWLLIGVWIGVYGVLAAVVSRRFPLRQG